MAFLRWLVLCLAVFVAANLPFLGITYENWTDVLIAALVLAVINTFVRPIIMLISLPLILFSLGLFILVINALLLLFVSWLMGASFVVPGFWSALGGSLVISIVSFFFGLGNGERKSRVVIRRGGQSREEGGRRPPPGDGPVIDI